MSRTPAQVQTEILALQPDGWAFPNDPDTYHAATLLALATEISSIEASMESFQTDLDPGTAQQLLPDYLRVLGPDPYGRDVSALSESQQQIIAHQRWVDAPIICPGFFIAMAAALGDTITIEEFELPVCGDGVTVCGDVLTPWGIQVTPLITLPATDVFDPVCGDTVCGDALGSFTPSLVAGVIEDRVPLWVHPVFSYTG